MVEQDGNNRKRIKIDITMNKQIKNLMLAGIVPLLFAACEKEGKVDESAVYDIAFSVKHDKLFDAFVDDATYGGDNFAELSWGKITNVSNYIYNDEGVLCARIDTVLTFGTSLDFSQSLPYGEYSVISAVHFNYFIWENWFVSGEESLQTFAIESNGYAGAEEYGTLGLTLTKVKANANKTVDISVTPITSLLTIRTDVTWSGDNEKVFENIDTLEIISEPFISDRITWDERLVINDEEEQGYLYCYYSIDPSYYGTMAHAVVGKQAVLPRTDVSFYPCVHYKDIDSWERREEDAAKPVQLESNKQYYVTYKLLNSKVEVKEITRTRAVDTQESNVIQLEHWNIEDGTIRLKRSVDSEGSPSATIHDGHF